MEINNFDHNRINSDELRLISGINFTAREIDIIACLVNNRGEKKIAHILSISPRTVSAHIRNIMQKLNCNSRESIIDSIEKSGKLRLLKCFYTDLLVSATFKNCLIKIGKLFNNVDLVLKILIKDNFIIEECPILQQLKKDLSLANVILNICNERHELSQKTLYLDLSMNYSTKKITLIFDKTRSSKMIDFREESNYYFSVLELLETIIDKPKLNEISLEFKNNYKNLVEDKEVPQELKYSQDEAVLNTSSVLPEDSTHPLDNKTSLIILITTITLLLTGLIIGINFYRNNQKAKEQGISYNISHILPKFFEELSVNNLLPEEAEKNYSIIKQFFQVEDKIKSGQIQQYFNSDVLKSSELMNCLYNLNAIASYALFKEHDTTKAEIILKYAKNLAERHIANRSRLSIDFDKLISEELYTELSIIRDLPEMYTMTLYFLGRSYLYNRNTELAEKYFKLSKYLGERINLFEGFLSIRNGLAIIESNKAQEEIRNKKYINAREKLLWCIECYKRLKEDKNQYKLNYRSQNYKLTTITPKNDIYNFIYCNKRLLILYAILIRITYSPTEKNEYAKAALNQLTYSDDQFSILEILKNSSEELNRIMADFYNHLGYFLLELWDNQIDFEQFKSQLTHTLNLNNKNELEFISEIFERAKTLSRTTEYTKADSYDGLIKIYKRLAELPNVTTQKKKQLLLDIKNFETKRDIINKKLKRNTDY